jgi:hypothetical protein
MAIGGYIQTMQKDMLTSRVTLVSFLIPTEKPRLIHISIRPVGKLPSGSMAHLEGLLTISFTRDLV